MTKRLILISAIVLAVARAFFQAHHTNLDPNLADLPDSAIYFNDMPYFYIKSHAGSADESLCETTGGLTRTATLIGATLIIAGTGGTTTGTAGAGPTGAGGCTAGITGGIGTSGPRGFRTRSPCLRASCRREFCPVA